MIKQVSNPKDDYDLWMDAPQPSRRMIRGRMPVDRDALANAAGKETIRSKRLSKEFARAHRGMQYRRKKKSG